MRAAGAVPATIGVLDGEIVVGLTEDELTRFGADARKVGPRDLAVAVEQDVGRRDDGRRHARGRARRRASAGSRPAASAASTAAFPIHPTSRRTSAQLARTPALVVSAGVKSLLDVPATAELLESLGVPVLGYRVDTLPLFYAAAGGPPVSARVESPAEAARVARGALGARGRRALARPAAGRAARRRRAADRARRCAPRTTRASRARA